MISNDTLVYLRHLLDTCQITTGQPHARESAHTIFRAQDEIDAELEARAEVARRRARRRPKPDRVPPEPRAVIDD